MTGSAILITTLLVILLVLAIALTVGALALLATGPRTEQPGSAGPLDALRLLDRQWSIERFIYRHHRAFGLIILLVGVFSIWQLGRTELRQLPGNSATMTALLWILMAGQAFNLLMGLFILLRPSLLKPLEALGNRWHELDPWGRKRTTLKTTAALLMVVGLVILVGSATLLVHHVTGSLT